MKTIEKFSEKFSKFNFTPKVRNFRFTLKKRVTFLKIGMGSISPYARMSINITVSWNPKGC